MKQTLLIILAVFISFAAGAQLRADAGPNQIWCINSRLNYGPTLGGAPTATQGTAPYTYSWRTLYTTYTAQDFLDSVTSDHPTLIAIRLPRVDSVFFELEVTDALAQKAYDTVRVYLSRWVCPTGENVITKAAADTVNMRTAGCMSAFGPNIFLYWTPSDYLADSSVANTKCWVPFSKQYYQVYMNQLGCRDSAFCYIDVQPTGIPKLPASESLLTIYPNPMTQSNRIACGAEWLGGTIRFYSADGKFLSSFRLNERQSSFEFKQPSGLYFYRAVSPKGFIQNGTLLKE